MGKLLEYAGKTQSNIIPQEEFQNLILEVFQTVADGVGQSLGPLGSVSTLIDGTSTTTTKDGFTIFNQIKFRNKFKCMAYGLIADPCRKLNNTVGDGTSTAIVLTKNMYAAYMQQKEEISRYYRLPRTFLKIWDDVVDDLKHVIHSYATPITSDEIYHIANIASNGDSAIAQNLFNIYSASESPTIVLKNSPTNKCFIESNSGFMFPNNLYDNSYCTTDDAHALFSDVRILVFDHKVGLKEFTSIIKPSNEINKCNGYSTMVIAPAYDETFMHNQLNPYLKQELYGASSMSLIITSYKYTDLIYDEQLSDLAALVGATVLTSEFVEGVATETSDFTDGKLYEYLTDPARSMCGIAPQIEASAYNGSTFIQNVLPENFRALIDVAKKNYEYEANNTEYEKIEYSAKLVKLKARISQLNMENYNYYIGSDSRLQTKLLYTVIEDVVKATKSARKYGTVPGCQLSIIKSCNVIDERYKGMDPGQLTNDDVLRIMITDIIRNAVIYTYRQVLEGPNGGGIKNILALIYPTNMKKISEEDMDEYIESKTNEIISTSIAKFKVLDIDSVAFSSDIISSVETDLNVLTAASELVKLLISSNQCIYVDSSTSGEEYLADI